MRYVREKINKIPALLLFALVLGCGGYLFSQATGAWTPATAGASDLGSTLLHFRDLYIGNSTTAANYFKFTGVPTTSRTLTWQDRDGTVEARATISGSGATVTLTAAQSGSTILMDAATGIVFTLPTPAVGLNYKFLASVSVTSNAYKFSTATQGTHWIVGGYTDVDTDTGNAVAAFNCDGTSHDNFSMNGTTTGGLIGSVIRLTAITTTVWQVDGIMLGNGTVATSCSTT